MNKVNNLIENIVSEIKISRSEIKALSGADLRREKKNLKALENKLKRSRKAKMYLESNPRLEYVNSVIEDLTLRINNKNEELREYLLGFQNHTSAIKNTFLKLHGVPKMKESLSNMIFVKSLM